MKIIITVMVFLLCSQAWANEPRIVFLNKCPDIDQAALSAAQAIPDRKVSYQEVTKLWTCLNKTQAAQSVETTRQVYDACRGIRCPTIYSIDPLIDREGSYNFGAWIRNNHVFFAAMPGCSNAQKILRRKMLLFRTRKGS